MQFIEQSDIVSLIDVAFSPINIVPVNTISRGIAETIVILKPHNRFSSNTSPFYLLLLPPLFPFMGVRNKPL